MEQIAGHCGKCGAPYYFESPWFGVTAPPPRPTCMCWNMPKTYTSNSTQIIMPKPEEPTP